MRKIYGIIERAFEWESGTNTSTGNVNNLLVAHPASCFHIAVLPFFFRTSRV